MSSLAEHHNTLLMQRRCAWCAERVPLRELLQGRECPHCSNRLQRVGGQTDMSAALSRSWSGRRMLGYSLMAIASFFSGAVPMLQALVMACGLLVLHIWLIRKALSWLPMSRRIAARLTIKLIGGGMTALAFIANVAVAPLVGASAFILALVGFTLSVAYVESALALVRRRIAWEEEGRPLQRIEWMLPTSLCAALLIVVLGSVGVVAGSLHLLATMDLPGISDLASWMLNA